LGEKLLQVGELAAAAGKTVRAIHLYEELGLLRPDARSKGRFRLYDPQAVTRVRWIGKLHDLGMSLSQIQEVVAEWEGAPSAGRAMSKVRSIYVSKLEETRTQIARLRDLERELTESIDYLDTCETCDSSLSDEAPIPDFSVAVVRRLPQIAETSHTHSHPTSGDAEGAPEVGSCASCAMRERENEPELVAGIHHYPIDHSPIEQGGAEVAARGNVPRARPSSVGKQAAGGKLSSSKPSSSKPSSTKPSSSKLSAGKPSRSVGE
jgi:DNA-binding transcriptional MerR regulator